MIQLLTSKNQSKELQLRYKGLYSPITLRFQLQNPIKRCLLQSNKKWFWFDGIKISYRSWDVEQEISGDKSGNAWRSSCCDGKIYEENSIKALRKSHVEQLMRWVLWCSIEEDCSSSSMVEPCNRSCLLLLLAEVCNCPCTQEPTYQISIFHGFIKTIPKTERRNRGKQKFLFYQCHSWSICLKSTPLGLILKVRVKKSMLL